MKGMLMSLGMFGCVMALTVLSVEIGSYLLFAQVDLPSSTPSIEGATGLTSAGFAIWYGWYATTKAIPRIVDQQQAQVDRMEAAHERQINSLTTTFREELRALRDTFSCDRREGN